MSSWSEIQRKWPRRTLHEEAYRGEIELFEHTPRLYGGELRALTVRITNRGTEHWPGLEREPWIKVVHRWRTANESGSGSWSETCLPASIAHGSSALVPVMVEAPRSEGEHLLECELVHEDRVHGNVIHRFGETLIQVDVQAVGEERRSASTHPDLLQLTRGA